VYALLTIWLLGVPGFALGVAGGWWSGRRGLGLGTATLVAIGIGVVAALALDVVIVQQIQADPSPNAPLALIVLPFPLISNTIGALVSVLLVAPVTARRWWN